MSPEILDLLVGPPVWGRLGKVRWKIRFNHLALLRLEQQIHKDILGGEFSILDISSRDLRGLVLATVDQPSEVQWEELRLRASGELLVAFQEAWRRDMPLPDPSRSPEAQKSDPPTWLDAWGNATQILGLSTKNWLSYTPRMIQILSKFHLERTRQSEWMLAQISANIANWSMSGPRTPIKPEVYMLHPWQDLPNSEEQTVEDVLRGFRELPGMSLENKTTIDSLIN